VHAHPQTTVGQALHRQAVVDLGGGGVVDREGVGGRQRQRFRRLGHRRLGLEAASAGEVFALESRQVHRAGVGEQAQFEQQPPGRLAQVFTGAVEGTVLERLLVGLDQQARASGGDGGGQCSRAHLLDHLGDGGLLLPPALERSQGQPHRFGGRRAKPAAALAVEVDGRRSELEQHARRLHRGGLAAEVVAGEIVEGEFVLRGALPEKVDVDLAGDRLGGRHELGGLGHVEAQQHLGRLDLGATP
jgi:hypothetical protein